MILTTRQVADRLGTGLSTVRTLARKGLLNNLQPGNRRHGAFDSKEVGELAKTYRNRKGPRVEASPGPGPAALADVAKPADQAPPRPVRLMEQLDRIEGKLDTLLGIWS